MRLDVTARLRRLRRERRDEGGFALVFIALMITVLMIFAAFAIDIGTTWGERRKSQNTADAGALSGGRVMLAGKQPLATPPSDVTVANEIIKITHANLFNDSPSGDANDLTLEQWTARFASCTDSERPATLFPVVSSVSPCISYSPGMTRVRVRLPNINVATSFARVMGIDHLTVTAFAEAELVPDGGGGLLPFGLPGMNANAPEVCLKSPSSSHPNAPPCGGPTSGNFGSIDIAFYGNAVLGTNEMCNGGTNLRLRVNIALGVDHPMDEYREAGEETESIRDDRASCPDLEARPNQVRGQTGIGSNLEEGLITGTSLNGHPVPGRLTLGPWATKNVRNQTANLDDRALWEFIDPSTTHLALIPPECNPAIITDKAGMRTCLSAYRTGNYTSVLFDIDEDADGKPDIMKSPRFAFVPEFHQLEWGSGTSDPYQIKAFRPVFLQTLFFTCSGTNGCDGIFDPGEPGSGLPLPKNKGLEAVTAMLLVDSMFPPVVVETGPAGRRDYTLVLRR